MSKTRLTPSPKIGLQTIYDSVMIGIVIMQKDGVIDSANKTALNLFSGNAKSLKGVYLGGMVAPRSQNDFEKYLESCLEAERKSKAIDSQSLQIKAKNGQYLSMELNFTDPAKGKDRFFIGLIKDISRRLELEEKVAQQKKESAKIRQELEEEKELNELKSRFISMASHEFRTPLAGILSSMQLVKRYLNAAKDSWEAFPNQQKIERHFDKIGESVANLNLILGDFLSVEKIEKEEISFLMQDMDLPAYLKGLIGELAILAKPGQKIIYRHVGTHLAKLDPHLLKNILNNLVSNAIKYSSENSVIDITSVKKEKTLQISVKDQGVGIPLSEQKNIFSRFFRAGNVTNLPGTGLGLSIVKEYVELMGGEINFESGENIGTTFIMKFRDQP